MSSPEAPYLEAMSVVGHELRRPLTVIRGAATLMLDSDGRLPPESVLQMLRLIDGSVEVMSDLIEDLLLMVHLEAGDLHLFEEPVGVSDLIADAVEAERRRAPDLAVSVVGAAPGLRVDGDRQRAVRALRALIANAAAHSPLEIAVSAGPGMVRVAVRDRGPGLDGITAERAFDRYAKGAGSSGLGLGLYLVRGVARAMGGEAGLVEPQDGGFEAWITLRRRG